MNNWGEVKLNKQLLNAINDLGFKEPTEIQRRCVPLIMGGQEVVGIAPTGTGKTAAFLIPLIRLLNYAQGDHPRVLIILPTRELALQLEKNFLQLAKYTDLRIVSLFGAIGPKQQIAQLQKGTDIVTGTPGRILELYSRGDLVLKNVHHFVMDEAERLMDKSFMSQLHALLEVLPRKRQHLLFSATMSPLVQKIMGDFITFPNMVHVNPEERTAATVSQTAYLVPNLKTKINLLRHLFANEIEFNKVIIFCKSKVRATAIAAFIARTYGNAACVVVHGNKAQQSRMHAMQKFTDKPVRFLVTTDVASRGIDVTLVSHVVNFDVPLVHEDYVHRIGRTGRATNSGKAITLVTMADEYHFRKIEKLIKQQLPLISIPPEVFIEDTAYAERQAMLREIDFQKKKENPEFKGAFHVKKNPKAVKTAKAAKPAKTTKSASKSSSKRKK
ncbi:MAG: DEAD/DEAH box helicase [Bacteroidetes bacterium]|nr:DEAD/DEAH box helicase [Bacteroidota bacterium]